jgi:hypothetical protein
LSVSFKSVAPPFGVFSPHCVPLSTIQYSIAAKANNGASLTEILALVKMAGKITEPPVPGSLLCRRLLSALLKEIQPYDSKDASIHTSAA